MDEDRDTLLAIRTELREADDILTGIAQGSGDFRTPNEVRGGLDAARDRVRNAWRRAIRASVGTA